MRSPSSPAEDPLPLLLGIETTCDETACAFVRGGKEILANAVFSQAELHQQYGGVFPELACRRHIDTIIPVIEKAFAEAGVTPEDVDAIAVAKGPGLIGPLLIGLNTAKALAFAWDIPLLGINHVEAHLYAAMMPLEDPPLPGLGLVVSGGHTLLVKIQAIGSYEPIGTTVDDSIGEAFDKVASLLGLPYPGGPAIEELAKQGDATAFPFKAGVVKGQKWDFSFSGLKTNVLYVVKGKNTGKNDASTIEEERKPDIAASFQETALRDVVDKAVAAAQAFGCRAIYVGGGVSNNQRLRALFREREPRLPVHFPEPALTLDNAAMIAGLGFHCLQKNPKGDGLEIEPQTRIPL